MTMFFKMLPAIIGLVGVLVGSFISHHLITQYQEKKESELQHSKCVSTLYILLSRCSHLVNFSNHYLSNNKSDIQDQFRYSVIYDYKRRDEIDFSSLAFLADKHDSNFLYELILAESMYFNFLSAYDTRNIALEKPISCVSKTPGKTDLFSPEELKQFIYNTESMVGFSKKSLQSTKEKMDKLAAIIERRFPKLPHPKPQIQMNNQNSQQGD